MKLDEVDPAQLVAAVREVAAENPDKVYRRIKADSFDGFSLCLYFEENGNEEPTSTPLCIVGYAFARIGVSHNEFKHRNNASVADVLDLERRGEFPVSDEVYWLSRVQHEQDAGNYWGEAITVADRYLRQRRRLATPCGDDD